MAFSRRLINRTFNTEFLKLVDSVNQSGFVWIDVELPAFNRIVKVTDSANVSTTYTIGLAPTGENPYSVWLTIEGDGEHSGVHHLSDTPAIVLAKVLGL